MFLLTFLGGATFFIMSGLSSNAYAADFYVNDAGDAVDANIGDGICATAGGVCTLRAAIQEANFNIDPDNIYLDGINGQTITLTGAAGEDLGATGDLDIRSPMVITFENNYIQSLDDTQTQFIIIEANGLERIFDIEYFDASLDPETDVRISLNGSQSILRNTNYINTEPGTGAIIRTRSSFEVIIEDFTVEDTVPYTSTSTGALISILNTGNQFVGGINFQNNQGTLVLSGPDVNRINIAAIIANGNSSGDMLPMFTLNASESNSVSNSDISNNTYPTYFDFGGMSGDIAVFRVNLSDNNIDDDSMFNDSNMLNQPDRLVYIGFNTIINNTVDGTGHIFDFINPNALVYGNIINWNQVFEMCAPGSEDFFGI